MIKLELKTKSISELQIIFEELHSEYRQVGLDDDLKGIYCHAVAIHCIRLVWKRYAQFFKKAE